ncbi:MFS transporter [Dictyobacter alpinus]|uniref:MFS transporter n=1 Tax=Dictyobacter alpinus TaxID=2014873 RepID=UPI000F820817
MIESKEDIKVTVPEQYRTPEAGNVTTHAHAVDSHAWIMLALLCVAQFVNVLNFQSVTLVLPAIARGLSLSTEISQWVVSANILAFGGGLLIAGRLADHIGHRRMFMMGVAIFALSSLLCGLSPLLSILIIARILQGLSAAMMASSAFALLIDIFPEGNYRNRAIGIWGAVGPIGGLIGTLVGSVLADRFGWPWLFFFNVPIALGTLYLAYRLLPRRLEQADAAKFDIVGALLALGSVVLLIESLTQIANGPGGDWLLPVLLLAGACALFVLFCWFETRIAHPLVPLHFFRYPNIAGANLASLAFSAAANTSLFFFALYMQHIRGFSAFMTGVAFMPTNIVLIAGSFVGARLVNRFGYKRVMLLGLGLLCMAGLLFSSLSINGSYLQTQLPALIFLGAGLGIVQIGAMGAGTAGVPPAESGLASGVMSMTGQIGTSIGLATLVSIAAIRSAGQPSNPAVLVAGYQWAFYGEAAFSLLGILLVLLTIRKPPLSADKAVTVNHSDELSESIRRS